MTAPPNRDAYKRGMLRAAFIAWDAEDETVDRPWENWGEHRNMVTAHIVQKEIAEAIIAEADALSPTPAQNELLRLSVEDVIAGRGFTGNAAEDLAWALEHLNTAMKLTEG